MAASGGYRTTKNLKGVETGASLAPAALRKMVAHKDSLGTAPVADPRGASRNAVGAIKPSNPRLSDRANPAAPVPNDVRPLPGARKMSSGMKSAMARRLRKSGTAR